MCGGVQCQTRSAAEARCGRSITTLSLQLASALLVTSSNSTGQSETDQVVTVRMRKAYPQVVDHVLHWVEESVGQLAQRTLYAPDGSASQNYLDGHAELPPHRDAEPFT